ncbi:class I SAM-dependent methyltransferase [Amycolatopsis sp. NPDC049688]|uniref:class I SAM-dependent methyltransferase n=1 Tax=Amycolatopsis sp. NPDC049688 TaxID=3154733 RepID=UPI003440DF2F
MNDPIDTEALDWVRDGYVIDVGCGTGRHLEMLARRGVRGHGVEVSPAAVSLARAAGVSCVRADVFSYHPPHPVDAVIAIGGNGGMAGTLEALPGFLLRLSSWLNERGRLVLTCSDWTRLPPEKLNGHGSPSRGYPGDVRMRFRLDDEVGAWFPWLLVDAETLGQVCSSVGLRIVERKEWLGGAVHGALIERAPSP